MRHVTCHSFTCPRHCNRVGLTIQCCRSSIAVIKELWKSLSKIGLVNLLSNFGLGLVKHLFCPLIWYKKAQCPMILWIMWYNYHKWPFESWLLECWTLVFLFMLTHSTCQHWPVKLNWPVACLTTEDETCVPKLWSWPSEKI